MKSNSNSNAGAAVDSDMQLIVNSSADIAANPMLAAVQFRENDVFNFRYKPDEAKKRFEPYHCFDGTLVVKKYSAGFYLVDTYWSSGDSRTFTPDEAIEKGELTFLCNLEEMDDIKEMETLYYDDADIVKMHIHAGYRSRFLIKKGTQRSQAKMLQSIKQKIEDEHSKIRSAENSLKWHNETLLKIEAGDTSVYL